MKMSLVDTKKVEEPAEVVVVSGANERPLHKSDEQQHIVLVPFSITSA